MSAKDESRGYQVYAHFSRHCTGLARTPPAPLRSLRSNGLSSGALPDRPPVSQLYPQPPPPPQPLSAGGLVSMSVCYAPGLGASFGARLLTTDTVSVLFTDFPTSAG